jgi:hypothetical protein
MTIVYLDNGSRMPNRYASRQFTASAALAYSCVRYFDPDNPNDKRPQEIVWRDGAFQYPYDIGSKKEGNLYTVVRQNGWASNLELHAEEVGGASSAQLQPLTSLSGVHAKAAWTMFLEGGEIALTDRTGNGWGLDGANKAFIPDLIPGKAAYNPFTPGTGGIFHNSAGPILLGAASVTARVIRTVPEGGYDAWVYAAGDYNSFDTSFSFLTCSVAHDVLTFYVRNSGVDHIFYSSLVMPADGQWHFVSCARDAAGYVTVGVDGVYETVGTPFDAQVTGAGSPVAVFGHAGSAGKHFGPGADIVLWDGWLPNSDVAGLRATAMGLS